MAESFGNAFTFVEVTANVAFGAEPTKQLWIALAKPRHVPDGWTAKLLAEVPPLTEKTQKMFEELDLKPGDVFRLPSK